MGFCGSFASLIEVFEFSEKLVCSSFSGQEPTECCEWSIHTTCCIDTGSDLESDDICISLNLITSLEKVSEAN